jgi:hypothetical protein
MVEGGDARAICSPPRQPLRGDHWFASTEIGQPDNPAVGSTL